MSDVIQAADACNAQWLLITEACSNRSYTANRRHVCLLLSLSLYLGPSMFLSLSPCVCAVGCHRCHCPTASVCQSVWNTQRWRDDYDDANNSHECASDGTGWLGGDVTVSGKAASSVASFTPSLLLSPCFSDNINSDNKAARCYFWLRGRLLNVATDVSSALCVLLNVCCVIGALLSLVSISASDCLERLVSKMTY